jgi:hypothetical protein
MSNPQRISNISQALTDRQFSTVTLYNRLEGRPRTDNFDRALRAEVRDALWMLSRQWQMGEFLGDDAGSPIAAKIHLATTQLNKYRPKQLPVRAFDNQVPLEAQVEQMPIPLRREGKPISLDIRLLMGRHWLKLLRSTVGDDSLAAAYRQAYPITAPSRALDPEICAHPEAWQTMALFAGRAMDGGALYEHLLANPGSHQASDTLNPPLAGPVLAQVNALGATFMAWAARQFLQPADPEETAWQPERLEYRFGCAAPDGSGEKIYEAEGYYHGHLDWYNLAIVDDAAGYDMPPEALPPDPQATGTTSFVPTELVFEGMPHSRWWTFEDRKTYFGAIDPNTTDLAKLLLIEFGLVYANDWFIVPHQVPAGTISSVKGLAVTNVFGERTWVEASGQGGDDDWQRWSMYTVSKKGLDQQAADTSLLVLPSVPKIQEGPALEDMYLLRDEVANMVWGVETTIPLATGGSKPGHEAAAEIRQHYERLLAEAIEGGLPPEVIERQAKVYYEVMNQVPEHWIPFIPVHLDGSNRQVQLRRASMPRILEGDPELPVKIKPRTALLRHGLDEPTPQPYHLHEEETPRAGVQVSRAYQRTRWYGGDVCTWIGVRKQAGRGEGSSGLAFDRLIPAKRR